MVVLLASVALVVGVSMCTITVHVPEPHHGKVMATSDSDRQGQV